MNWEIGKLPARRSLEGGGNWAVLTHNQIHIFLTPASIIVPAIRGQLGFLLTCMHGTIFRSSSARNEQGYSQNG